MNRKRATRSSSSACLVSKTRRLSGNAERALRRGFSHSRFQFRFLLNKEKILSYSFFFLNETFSTILNGFSKCFCRKRRHRVCQTAHNPPNQHEHHFPLHFIAQIELFKVFELTANFVRTLHMVAMTLSKANNLVEFHVDPKGRVGDIFRTPAYKMSFR